MDFRDYYQILGVERDASQDEIKRAYRKLARQFHPDVSSESDAEARFKEVGAAYEVLKDPEKRVAYDQLGANWQGGEQFTPPPGWDAGFEFGGGGFTGGADFSEFFESLFGRATQGSHRQGFQAAGEDRHAKILIDLEDAFTGATRAVSLRVPEVDPHGHMVAGLRTLNVKIPKGVKSGQRIRLAGQGAPGLSSGTAGDLYLEIEFRPHARYRVEERDLYLDLPIAPWEAALGYKVQVPTPSGKVDLTIPPGAVSGQKLRLKGRGIPGNPAGDLYMVLQIALPPANTEQIKALYKEMADTLAFNPRAKLGV